MSEAGVHQRVFPRQESEEATERQPPISFFKRLVLDEVRSYVPEWGQTYIDATFVGGDREAAFDLSIACHDFMRLRLVRDAYDFGVSPAVMAVLLKEALTQTHCFRHATRAPVVRWCKYAGVDLPKGLPNRVEIYRGVREVEPIVAAKGFSWTLSFDCAAWFAIAHRVHGAHLADGYVLKAKVPPSQLIFYDDGRGEKEVFTERSPRRYEVVRAGLQEASDRFRFEQKLCINP